MKCIALVLLIIAQNACAQVFIGPTGDPYVATRVRPGSIPALPITPTFVNGLQQVGINQNLYTAFRAQFAAQLVNGFMLVNTVTGNDANCTVNTSLACKSLFEALKEKVDSIIYVTCPASGVYNDINGLDFDFRFGDVGYGNGVKMVLFDRPCHLVFRGDNVGTNTWTGTGGHVGMYQTTLSCYPSNCGQVSIVLRTDQNDGSGYVDEWGAPFPDRLYAALPNPCANPPFTAGQYVWVGSFSLYQATATTNTCPPGASWTFIATGISSWGDGPGLANLDQLSEGWYFSINTGVLYAKLNNLDLTNPANAAKLSARYYEPGGNTPRVNAFGGTVFWQNVYLDGMHFESAQFNNSGTFVNGAIWCQDCTMFAGIGYGAQIRGGSWDNFQNAVAHANAADGWNMDTALDGVTQSNSERVYVRGTWAGDPHTYFSGILPSIPAVCNGESSHGGYAVDIGGFYAGNMGPEVGDGGRTGSISQTWDVGTLVGPRNPINTFNWGGVVELGNSLSPPNNRVFWLDTVSTTQETFNGLTQALYVETTAVCNLYNTIYDPPIVYQNGAATCVSYTPNAP